MAQASAWQLERYRPLLRVQARQIQLDPRLQRRFDGSDLVQETLLRAHQNLGQFRGQTEAELIAWLRQILGNVCADKIDEITAQKRDVRLEREWRGAVAESSARLDTWLAAKQPSPSEQVERKELLLRFAATVDQLPDDQRDVVIARDLLETPVGEIARQLGRTEKAVAGLLLRGRRKVARTAGRVPVRQSWSPKPAIGTHAT